VARLMINNQAFRELLDLLMVSDPEPVPMEALKKHADEISKAHGFDCWIVAFHEFPQGEE